MDIDRLLRRAWRRSAEQSARLRVACAPVDGGLSMLETVVRLTITLLPDEEERVLWIEGRFGGEPVEGIASLIERDPQSLRAVVNALHVAVEGRDR